MTESGPSGARRDTASPQLGRSRLLVAMLGLLALVGVLAVPGFAGAQSGSDASDIGKFERAFEASDKTEFEKNADLGPSKPPFGSDSSKCILVPPKRQNERQRNADPDRDGFLDCKVAANSANLAPNGDYIYWNNLEATENIKGSIVSEYGVTSINDQSRVLSNIGDPGKRKWSKPKPIDGGANANGNLDSDPFIPGLESKEPTNDGSFFCAEPNWLPDGRIVEVGGTEYSSDPGQVNIDADKQLEGLLDKLSVAEIAKLLKGLSNDTTVEDVADSVPGSDTSVGDLVDGLGLPDAPDTDPSSSDSDDEAGKTKLGDLSNHELEKLAKELDNKQIEDLVEGLSNKELRDLFKDNKEISALLGGTPGQQEGNTTPEGTLEGAQNGYFGATELEGIKSTRIYDPKTKKWTQSGDMSEGRWYPSLVTLANGDQFVTTGLRKLIRGIYTPGDEEFGDPDEEGGNNEETETFDIKTGVWSLNGPKASEDPSDRELPLKARMHLLPNGHVFYAAGGQAFNPLGQDVNEAEWNMTATYNPSKKAWTTLGIPGALDRAPGKAQGPTPAEPGFRGSTFSVQMPLKPNADGKYTVAEHLQAGGLAAAVPSPGTYFPVKTSRVIKVDTSGETETTQTRDTGPLNQGGEKNTGRWYSAGTLLPTGEVLASSGGDADEVALPGSEASIKTMELFDPKTETWRNVARQAKNRTYHNSATLLPDGRVAIGGLATISTGYGRNAGIPQPQSPAQMADPNAPGSTGQGRTGQSTMGAAAADGGGNVVAAPDNDGQVTNVQGHDPSIEIYSPPNLFRGKRPEITGDIRCQLDYDDDLAIDTNTDVSDIDSVVVMRNTSFDHIIDDDQKSVVLAIDKKKSKGKKIVVHTPPNSKVAPPGPYLLFVNKSTPDGPTPVKKAEQVFFGGQGSCGGDRNSGASNNDNDGFDVPGITPGAKCLEKGLKASNQGIGPLLVGMTRPDLVLKAGSPARFGRRAFRYCVQGGGRTYVSFDGRGVAQMIVSVNAQFGPKGLNRGNSTAAVRAAYRDATPLGKKQLVARLPGGGAVVFGIKDGRVRYVAVINSRLADDLQKVRYFLRGVRLQ